MADNPTSSLAQVLDDPDFYKLSRAERLQVLSSFPESERADILRPEGLPQLPKPDAGRVIRNDDESPAVQGFGRGVGKGIVNTAHGIFKNILRVDPNSPGMKDMEEFARSNDTPEAIGKGTEQVAEFAAPSAIITKAAKIGQMGRAGQFLVRALAEGGTSGVINKMQGGAFTTGAAAGGVAGAAGAGIRLAKPIVGQVLRQPLNSLVPKTVGGALADLAGVGGVVGAAVTDNPVSRFVRRTVTHNLTQSLVGAALAGSLYFSPGAASGVGLNMLDRPQEDDQE